MISRSSRSLSIDLPDMLDENGKPVPTTDVGKKLMVSAGTMLVELQLTKDGRGIALEIRNSSGFGSNEQRLVIEPKDSGLEIQSLRKNQGGIGKPKPAFTLKV